MRQFFDPDTPDEERRATLKDYRVSYVLYGTEERGIGSVDFGGLPYLEMVFDSDQAAVYRVHTDILASERSTQ